jgi:hypothetical protein
MTPNRETKQNRGDVLAAGGIMSPLQNMSQARGRLKNRAPCYSPIFFTLVDTIIDLCREEGKGGRKCNGKEVVFISIESVEGKMRV